MGSREEVPTEPQEKPKFIEDMNESELASAVSCCKISQNFDYNFISSTA
jgi:hypothetical protein